jgi:hypothetical protein
MARFKPARGKRAAAGPRPNAVGCIALLVFLFLLLFWIMYLTVSQG